MPANAWAAIQVSDLIPISHLQMSIFACKRYHCVQKHPNFKVDSQQASIGRRQYRHFTGRPTCVKFSSSIPTRIAPTFLATALSDITSLIVGVREVILKHHGITGFQQASHEPRDLLEGTSPVSYTHLRAHETR